MGRFKPVVGSCYMFTFKANEYYDSYLNNIVESSAAK